MDAGSFVEKFKGTNKKESDTFKTEKAGCINLLTSVRTISKSAVA